MKNVLKAASFFVVMIQLGIGIPLDAQQNVDKTNPIELTSEQKMDDIRYFYDFIKRSYPFEESIVAEKGLESIYKYEDSYIEKAGKTKNNKEFIKLVAELIQMLEQGTGHSDIMEAQNLPADFDTTKACLVSDISKASIRLHKYWWNLLDIDSKYSHSDLVVHYRNGEYVIVENFKSKDISIPKGTKIIKIDGQLTNDYIKSLQHKIWLRFDPYLKIPYSFHPSPFITYGDESKTSWYVEFQDTNGRVFSYSIPKLDGFRDVRTYPIYDGNILCKELAENIAYIRVFLLPGYSNAGQDLKELENFFAGANGKYKKLIIDLRRNYGGSPAYGGELLIRPFIKKASQCIQYAAVKKDIYNKLSKRMALIDSLEKYSVKEVDFGEIRKIKFDELPDKIKTRNKNDELFYYFKTTKLYEPLNQVNFDGNIFLLIDNYCFSATEDIIRSFKELKIAKIVGTSSLGGAAAVLQPWIFELPNSHILFTLEVELAFNSDGTVNELYGTKPDVELEPSTYPTSFPESFSREDLINDKWISWIMNN